MKSLRETALVGLVILAVASAYAYCAQGCTPAELRQDAAAFSYEAQQMRCVEQYARKADIDRCRMKVKLAWSTVDAGTEGGDR